MLVGTRGSIHVRCSSWELEHWKGALSRRACGRDGAAGEARTRHRVLGAFEGESTPAAGYAQEPLLIRGLG